MRESLNAIFEQLHAKNTVTVGQERDEHVAHLVYMQTTIIGSPTWHLMLQEGAMQSLLIVISTGYTPDCTSPLGSTRSSTSGWHAARGGESS